MKIIFMGTPEFAVPSLEKLITKYNVVAVVTQPDKPKSRGKKAIYLPIKEIALKNNIPILQPVKLREEQNVKQIKEYEPDLIVVVAFGQILSQEILNIPKYGCINIHGSLLPKYRGSSPIQWSIINGETITGVTTMFMDVGIDTGDMLLKSELPIEMDDTYISLSEKMSLLGADLLIETLEKLEAGLLIPQKQNDEESTYFPMIKVEMGHIDWYKSSVSIINLIRGLNFWPTAYTFYNDDIYLKIWNAEIINKIYANAFPGKIVEMIKDKGFIVKTGDGAVLITEVQAKGGKRMKASDYVREIGRAHV